MKSWNEIRKAATAFSKRWKNAYNALNRPTSRNGDTFGYNERGEVVYAMKKRLLIFATGASMIAVFCLAWLFHETTIRASDSPDERYALAVIRRNLDSLPVITGGK